MATLNVKYFRYIRRKIGETKDSKEMEELYEKVRETERSYLSSKLWNNERIRRKVFSLAQDNNVIAQEGSIKIYAEDKQSIREYYKSLINAILKPIFNIESLDERMKRAV